MDLVSKLFLCNLSMILLVMFVESRTDDILPEGNIKEALELLSDAWALLTFVSVVLYTPYFFFVVVD